MALFTPARNEQLHNAKKTPGAERKNLGAFFVGLKSTDGRIMSTDISFETGRANL
jgi:hypothetical protein